MDLRPHLPVVLGIGAYVISGCGGSPVHSPGNGPAAVLAEARSAADRARSVHVLSPAVGLDGVVTQTGSDFKAESGVGGSEYTIWIGKTTWVKFDNPEAATRFLGRGLANYAAGQWIKIPAVDIDSDRLLGMTAIIRGIDTALTSPGALRFGARTQVNGQKSIVVINAQAQVTTYLAEGRTPYPLKIVRRTRGITTTLLYDGWNGSFRIKAPTGAIDMTHVRGLNSRPPPASHLR